MTTQKFTDLVAPIRAKAADLITDLDELIAQVKAGSIELQHGKSTPGEMIAQLTLAKRAAELARMHPGMAIKAWDGGQSAYNI